METKTLGSSGNTYERIRGCTDLVEAKAKVAISGGKVRASRVDKACAIG
jgi:hypothetical protein